MYEEEHNYYINVEYIRRLSCFIHGETSELDSVNQTTPQLILLRVSQFSPEQIQHPARIPRIHSQSSYKIHRPPPSYVPFCQA